MTDKGNLNVIAEEIVYKDLKDTDTADNYSYGVNVSGFTGAPQVPQGGTTTLSGSTGGHIKEGITWATMGEGNINAKKTVVITSDSDKIDVNRDISKRQEITRNDVTGGLDIDLTIDNEMITNPDYIPETLNNILNLPGNIIRTGVNTTKAVGDMGVVGLSIVGGKMDVVEGTQTYLETIEARQAAMDIQNYKKNLTEEINSGVADKDAAQMKETLSEADQALGGNGKIELYDSNTIPPDQMTAENGKDRKDSKGFIENDSPEAQDRGIFVNANADIGENGKIRGVDLTDGADMMGFLSHEESHRKGMNEAQADIIGDVMEDAWENENFWNGNTTGMGSGAGSFQRSWVADNKKSDTFKGGNQKAVGVRDFEADWKYPGLKNATFRVQFIKEMRHVVKDTDSIKKGMFDQFKVVLVADNWEDVNNHEFLDVGYINYWQQKIATSGNHPENMRFPGTGLHLATEKEGGPVYLHNDFIDPAHGFLPVSLMGHGLEVLFSRPAEIPQPIEN